MTAPNLRKGQRVVVWRTADEEQLYWQPKGGDSELDDHGIGYPHRQRTS